MGWPLPSTPGMPGGLGTPHPQLLLEKEKEPIIPTGMPLWGSSVFSVPGGRTAHTWRSGGREFCH